ncbi:MAG: LysR family transcriptional regulator [Agitococcus sp.]|nr:LysR family transcriptional regulator [Agitococcus sp.]
MDRLEAMRVFCTVVDTGSFASAANKLEQSTSAISRWVAQLETHLQVRLLNRTTRRISLTESGHAYYERCSQWLHDLEAIESAVSEQAVMAQGTLKITTSFGFGLSYLAPAIASCQHIYPQLQFNVSLSGGMIDLVEEGFDLALRIGTTGSQNVVAKAIGNTSLIYVASPEYLASAPPLTTPEDLYQHRCLTYEHSVDNGVWSFFDQQQQQHNIRVTSDYHSDNSNFLTELAAKGLGISCAPCFVVTPYLNAGKVVKILPNYHTKASTIYAVYPHRRHLSAKVRLFITFFENWLHEQNSQLSLCP